MTNNTTNQEKRCLKHWILKFLIIVATILVLALAVCLGYRYRVKTVTTTVLEMFDDEVSGLMDNVTADPEEGTDQINTAIR